jgi:hypothetical protein
MCKRIVERIQRIPWKNVERISRYDPDAGHAYSCEFNLEKQTNELGCQMKGQSKVLFQFNE